MNSALDISWFNLAIGYLLLLIPLGAFWFFQTGLVKETLIAALRMTVQLLLVGFYLGFIFQLDSMWINLLWVLIMIIAAGFTTTSRSELNYKIFLVPIFFALAVSIVFVDLFFFTLVIKLDNVFSAVYLIPITGMLLGNCIRSNVIGLNSFYNSLRKDQTLYRYALASGATRTEALMPFMRDSIKLAFNPTIATMAVIGLVSLPGMMTGQILGGSSPMVAIKYQIMLMITILTTSVITVLLTIYISNKFVFNEYDLLNPKVIKEKNNKNSE